MCAQSMSPPPPEVLGSSYVRHLQWRTKEVGEADEDGGGGGHLGVAVT